MLTKAILDDPVIHARTKGVGVFNKDQCRLYGALGPTARSAGYDVDDRRDHPIDAYDKVRFNVILCEHGDVFDKAVVRQLENFESIKIIRQCLKLIEDTKPGEICAEIREVPPGEGIGVYEAPRGEVLHYVRSNGGNMPMRHKVRAPSFNNILTNELSVLGNTVADAGLITAAVDPCYSCTERVGVVDRRERRAARPHGGRSRAVEPREDGGDQKKVCRGHGERLDWRIRSRRNARTACILL